MITTFIFKKMKKNPFNKDLNYLNDLEKLSLKGRNIAIDALAIAMLINFSLILISNTSFFQHYLKGHFLNLLFISVMSVLVLMSVYGASMDIVARFKSERKMKQEKLNYNQNLYFSSEEEIAKELHNVRKNLK